MSGVSFVNPDTGLVVGENGKVLFTSNGGATWTAQVSGVSDWLASVKFVNANVAYAVGANGRIIKFGTTTGMPTIMQEVSDQVYPNPASEKVFFSSEIAKAEALSISDINGRELLKADRNFLESAEGMNIDMLNPGVYFVNIRYATQTSVQKLIVR
jgi:hypothetical protein